MVFPELALTGYPPEDLLLKTHFLDAAGGRAATSWPRRTHGIVALVGFPERADDVYNAAAVLADGEVAAVYRKMHLPNYGVFDEQRYFQAGDAPATFDAQRRDRRPHDLRGHLGAGAAGQHRGAGRRRGDREPVRLALPRRQGRGARADARPARARQPRRGAVLQHRRRPGRAGVRRPQRRHRPGGRDGRARAAVRGGAHALHDRPGRGRGRPAARPAPPHRRASASGPRRRTAPAELAVARGARPAPARSAVRWPSCSRPRRRSTPRCAPACATTCARTASSAWCSGCPAASTRRWWRCWRSTRSAPTRVTCVSMPSPYSSEGTQRRRPRDRRQPRHGAPGARDRGRRWPRYDALLGDAVRGPRARPGRGEPPGAHPRQPGDGAVEQVRLAGADHRQQVRAVGGLRHALRRHGGRLRRAQGRVQGLGLPAGASGATRRRSSELVPDVGARPAAVGRAARRPAATRTRCRPTTCSTRSSPATWSRTSTPPSWWPRACPPRTWSA